MIIEIGVILRSEPYGNNHSLFAAQEEQQCPKGPVNVISKDKVPRGLCTLLDLLRRQLYDRP